MYIAPAHYDFEKYPDNTGLSPSSLNLFKQCPYYYWAKRVAEFWEDEENDAFVMGSAADCLVTEGIEAYQKNYIVVPKRTEALRTEALKTEAEKNNQVLITPKQDKLAKSMMTELVRQPIYSKFTGEGWSNQEWIEANIVDEFDNTSVLVRGKMDFYHKSAQVIADLKTCANLERFKPEWYAMQLGLYHEMAKIRDGVNCNVFIIAVDKTAMTRSRIFLASEGIIEGGKKRAREIIEQLKACRTSHAWDKQPFDDEKIHECPTYATCPYAIQKRIFTF